MRKKRFWGLLMMMCIATGIASAANTTFSAEKMKTETDPVPKAVVEKPGYSFDPVVEGTIVTHEYQIENKGQAVLDILKVRTSCGCTTAAYTKQIKPGDTGKIAIKGNTAGYGNRVFHKTISVSTNDPKHPDIRLAISGKVEKFVFIEPKRVVLRGHPGEEIHTTVVITPIDKYPFQVMSSFLEKSLEDKVSFTVEKKESQYLLVVNSISKKQGSFRGYIHLKTDSPVKPDIPVRVNGIIIDKKE